MFQTPSLWSTLIPSICLEPYALRTFLDFSDSHPLDVSIALKEWTEQGDDALATIFGVSECVRALFLGVPWWDEREEWQAFDIHPSFSSLECLEMDGSLDIHFAHDLLDHILPTARSLSSLAFRSFTVQWDRLGPHLSQTITKLRLINAYAGGTNEQYGVLDILNSLPALECITIQDSRPCSAPEAYLARWSRKITFPNLKYLKIRGPLATVTSLLGAVSSYTSSRLVVVVTLKGDEDMRNTYTEVLSCIALPSDTFTVSLSFCYWESVVHLSFDSLPHDKPLVTITFSYSSYKHRLSAGVFSNHLSQKVPNILPNVQDVLLVDEYDFTERFRISPSVNNVATLALQPGQDGGNVDIRPKPDEDIVVFPNLRRLRIEGVIFEEWVRSQLSEILETWDKLGYRVPLLSLTRCSIPDMTGGTKGPEDFKKWLGDRVDILELNGTIL